MRLGIDAREIQDGVFTGIGRPLMNFLKYFADQKDKNDCILFSEKKLPFKENARIQHRIIPHCPSFFWDQVRLPREIREDKIDLFYSPYYKIPLSAPCPAVSAILDLMYLVFDEYRRELGVWRRGYYATFGRLFARRSTKIFTCSEFSKRDIIKIYDIPTSKIEVIPLSVSDMYHPEKNQKSIAEMKDRYGIHSRYLLYLGNFKSHKNVEGIIKAFKNVVVEHRDLVLVLAGPKTHGYEQLVTSIHEIGLKNRVIFTGKITESDKPHLLYSGAEIFVFPSFYEGFGIPPLEAMACGTPVVASNTTSIPEVVKDAGFLVDPYHPDDIAQAIRRILNTPSLRQVLVEKGLRYAEEYQEEKISKRFYEFLKAVILHE